MLGREVDRSSPRHRIPGVEEQVDDHVTEVGCEPSNRRKRADLTLDSNGCTFQGALPFDPGAHDVDGFAYDRRDVDRFERPVLALAGEILEPSHDQRRVADDPRQSADVVALLGPANRTLLDERKPKAHGMEGVVEVVGDARCQLTDGAHSLLAHERFAQVVELDLGAFALLRARRLFVRNQLRCGRWKAQDLSTLACGCLPSRFCHPATFVNPRPAHPRKRDYE